MSSQLKSPRDVSGASDNLPNSQTLEQDDHCDLLGVDLLYQMDIEDITALRKHFFPESNECDWQRSNPQGVSLSKPEFIQAMDSIAGSGVLSLCAAKLFDALDIDGSGLLQWEEVLDAIIEKTGASRKDIEATSPICPEVSMHSVPHCRGETIVKVIPLETDTTFCYAIASKMGRIGVYDGKFTLLDSYKLGLKPDEEAVRDFNEFDTGESESRQRRRSVSTFLTDAIFIPDTYALLFAVSDRSLHLYDATGLVHVPLCHIIGMANVPTCVDYHSSTDNSKPSLLFLGDDHGDVTVMRFHQSKNTLFKKKHPDKLDTFYWMELKDQSEYVTYKIYKNVHSDAVRQITFCVDNDTVLSCSNDQVRTLVVRHIDDRREPYLFKLPRGVRCFHEDRILHILVTGGADHVVRLWNPVVTQRPLVSLYGHKSAVMDVRVLRFINAVLSLEAQGVIKLWDVRDECCMMTLPLNFPVYQIPGKKIEFGTRALYPGPPRIQEMVQETRSTRSSKEAPPNNAARTSFSGSNPDDVQSQTSQLDFRITQDEEWQRDAVVVICCNYAARVQINPELVQLYNFEQDLSNFQLPSILPPPTKEHYASAPSPWRTGDVSHTPRGSIGSKSTKSTDSSSGSLPLRGKEAVAAAAPVKDIHKRRTQHRIKQEQMQMLVEQGAPHLALDLHPLQPIRFSRPLPGTTRMREKGIDLSDPERLLKTRIHRDSNATSAMQGALSGDSSPKSSKSSKSVPIRKRTGTAKGRSTPEWFADRIKPNSGSTSGRSGQEKN